MATDYYVDGAVGNDSNAGTSEGAGNALATIAAGFLKILALGDNLYIKASVTYAETVTASTFIPTGLYPSIVEGYTSTPGDGGTVTITGSSSRSYGIVSARGYYIYRNIKIIDCTHSGWSTGGADYCTWDNCEAHDNTIYGLYADNGCVFINCKSTGNRYGIYVDNNARIINCYLVDNDQYALRAGQLAHIYGTVMAGGSVYVCYAPTGPVINQCVVDGYGIRKGIYSPTGYYGITIMNTIIYDCTNGIECTQDYNANQNGLHNLVYSNTTNYVKWTATSTDLTSDPLFTDAANGDYTLGTGSPAIGAAFPDRGGEERNDIGAYQTALPSGGTSRIILTS